MHKSEDEVFLIQYHRAILTAIRPFSFHPDYDDIYSEALLSALKARDSWDSSKSKLLTHIMKCCRFTALNYMNRKSSGELIGFIGPNPPITLGLDQLKDTVEADSKYEEDIENTEYLNKIVNCLTEEQYTLIERIIINEETKLGVAKSLGISHTACDKKLKRVLSICRELLSDKE